MCLQSVCFGGILQTRRLTTDTEEVIMSNLEIIKEIRDRLFHTLLVVDAHWLQVDPTVRQIVKEAHDTVLSEMLRLRKEELKGGI